MSRTLFTLLIAPWICSALSAEPFQVEEFDQKVLPMVERYCIDCHDTATAEGDFDLEPFLTPAAMLANRKPWEKVLKQLRAEAMPPDGKKRPADADREAAVAWLEQALIHVDPSKPVPPGRVTARRLNRTEYNHTIRDLFGVSLKLADEFAEDDVGYGFDNIGDVLSISPLRMEQYLNAAEQLTAILLGKTESPPYDEFSEGVFFQFNQKPRNPSDRGWEIVPEGQLWLDFELPAPGEYEIKLYAWGVEKPEEKDRSNNERWLEKDYPLDPKARPVVEATLLCDDQLIGHVPVQPGNGTTASRQIYTLRFTAQAGVHTIRVHHRFPREFTPEQIAAHLEKPLLAPRLGVRRVALRGPLQFGAAKLAPAHEAMLRIRPGDGLSEIQAAEKILRAIGDRAFRRPLKADELNDLLRFVETRRKAGEDFERAIELAVQTLLVSPKFLFRLDNVGLPPGKEDIAPLGDYALASRLSYFLWASMPDDELLALAAKGTLHEPQTLAAQVERLLADPRGAAFIEAFFGQWLDLRKVPEVTMDRGTFKTFSTELKDDLRRETTMFVESIVRENRPALELLTADYSFLNGRLAAFYGIPGIDRKAEFQRVSLTGTPRQGVLTQGSLLMLTSYPNRTSPTRRGAWILETILGEEPPPPPPNVPELEQTRTAAPNLSLREQLVQHRVNPTCVSCHRTMDAIGFGLENFDGIGKWRDTDQGRPIDASGDLPGGKAFKSPQELIAILSSRDEDFVRHLGAKLLTFALGRGVEYYDRVALDEIIRKTRPDGYRFRDLVREVALSRPFRFTQTQSHASPP
jgi:hypothetical protein